MKKDTTKQGNKTVGANEVNKWNPVNNAETQRNSPWVFGANYFIRTVTHHFTGRLIGVYDHELVLADAAWIADDGRFMAAVAEGKFNEVEPYPDGVPVVIGRGSVIDAVAVTWALPRAQK